MTSPKSLIRRKSAKAVAVHSAHGTISKLRRRPARTGTLVGLGMTLGTAIGFLLGRRGQDGTAQPAPSSTLQTEPAKAGAAPTPPVVSPV